MHEESRDLLQSSILSSRNSRNLKSRTISSLKDLINDNDSSGIANSNSFLLNNLSMMTTSTNTSNFTGNTSISNATITISKVSNADRRRNSINNIPFNNSDNNEDHCSIKSKSSFNTFYDTSVHSNLNVLESLKEETENSITEEEVGEEVEEEEKIPRKPRKYRIDSTSSMGTNIHTFSDLPAIPSINMNNSIANQDRLPQRISVNRHFYNNHYYGSSNSERVNRNHNESVSQVESISSSVSQFYPIYTSHNADFEMESTFSTSLTSSSSFIGEDEIYAKYYHQHESSTVNDQCFSSSLGSRSGIGTTISSGIAHPIYRSRFSSVSRPSQSTNLSSYQNISNTPSSVDSTTSHAAITIDSQISHSNMVKSENTHDSNNSNQYSNSYGTNVSGNSLGNEDNCEPSFIEISQSNKEKIINKKQYGVNKNNPHYTNYIDENKDKDNESDGEIEDVIVPSSGYVEYDELSDSEFEQVYMKRSYQ
ncbi:hypothetical protein PIROE2DRAFT_2680 [Piromyces sp. E2]|nr:hypothetical protein PIROE2DRAFT_2680 [Piromyces sp. E2]|eukprot:OUM69381.1 hypothetical protein PIROE2DRAFT_2680 [Piromyces sp. E2]